MQTLRLRRIGMALMMALLLGVAFVSGTHSPAQAQSTCPPPRQLVIGFAAYVTPGEPNILRSLPGVSSPQTGVLEGGQTVLVREGPVCVDGYNWWRVEAGALHGGFYSGWTADGTLSIAWLQAWQCGGMFSQHIPGMQTWVTPGLPNTLRARAGAGANIGAIPGGSAISILSGPECVGRRTWWYVSYNSQMGWTAEGENGSYWLDPYYAPTPLPLPTQTPITPPGCWLTPRLSLGYTGWITAGEPNVLRDLPGRNASGSHVIGQVPGATSVRVLEGPVCADGIYWWYVSDGVQFGWTAEGENNTYWMVPVACGGLSSRLLGGQSARVTPGVPNRLRTSPDTSSPVLANIPAGATVRVLNNYACDAQGHLWWQVRYGRRTGWTAEGLNGIYWLEPAS